MTISARPQLNVLTLGFGLTVLFAAWFDTARHLFTLVWYNGTYSHGVWVPVVSIVLIWLKRDDVLRAGPRFWWPGVVFILGIQGLWLVGALLEARVVEHLALVLSVQAVVLTCLGLDASRPIRFPLAFLFLIIPIGEQLVGPLQVITAKSVIWALDVTGFSFKADGVLIELSSGLYQVARACAGVKFLFTSLVMGVLLCHLAFESWYRRAMMLLASVLVPILANALRVYTTLLIAEWTDQSFAKEVDHIVYGWGFLSVVLLLLIAGAYRFSDKDVGRQGSEDTPTSPPGSSALHSQSVALVGMTVAAMFLPILSAGWVASTETLGSVCYQKELVVPECDGCGYRLLSQLGGGRWFSPDQENQNRIWHYRRDATNIMGLTSLYEGKGTAHRMGRSIRYLLPPHWDQLEGGALAGKVSVPPGFAEYVIWQGDRRRLLWQAFVIDGVYYAGVTHAKLALAMARLRGRTATAQRIIVSSAYDADADIARESILGFLSTFGPDAFLWKSDKTGVDDNLCAA